MTSVSVHEARTHLSKLLRRVATGEDVVISRPGKPVVRLVPVDETLPRSLGHDRDLVVVSADFDAPLPTDVLWSFEK